jgi:hypothetical protein
MKQSSPAVKLLAAVVCTNHLDLSSDVPLNSSSKVQRHGWLVIGLIAPTSGVAPAQSVPGVVVVVVGGGGGAVVVVVEGGVVVVGGGGGGVVVSGTPVLAPWPWRGAGGGFGDVVVGVGGGVVVVVVVVGVVAAGVGKATGCTVGGVTVPRLSMLERLRGGSGL